MTLDEAKVIAKLIGSADGACGNCVSDMVAIANRILPEWKWTLADRDTFNRMEYKADWQSKDDEPLYDSYLTVTVEPR